MEEMKDVAVLENEIEAGLLESILEARGIPHMMASYYDAAYDGLFQVQKGWGCVRAAEADLAQVLAILDEIRERARNAAETTPEEEADADEAPDEPPLDYDADEVDEMTLALLYLTTFDEGHGPRAWKGMDWGALSRLHEKGYIDNPRSKAKSVMLTPEGARLSEELFDKHFGLRG